MIRKDIFIMGSRKVAGKLPKSVCKARPTVIKFGHSLDHYRAN